MSVQKSAKSKALTYVLGLLLLLGVAAFLAWRCPAGASTGAHAAARPSKRPAAKEDAYAHGHGDGEESDQAGKEYFHTNLTSIIGAI